MEWNNAWAGWNVLSPVLRMANFYTAPPGHGFGPRFIQEFQVLFVQSGAGTARVDDATFDVSPGDLVFYGPRQRHEVVAGSEHPLRLIGLVFVFVEGDERRLVVGAPHSSDNAFRYPRGGPPRCPLKPAPPVKTSCGVNGVVRRQCESLVLSYISGAARRPMEKRGLLLELFDLWHDAILMQERRRNGDDGIEGRNPLIPLPHRRAIEEAQRAILNDLTEAPTLEELAMSARLAPAHFARLFRRQCGTSVMQYVNQQRLLHARRLLVEGRLNVKEVAHAVGFDDPFYFSRRFTRYFGMTPSVVRNGQGMI
jgi:AraC-like DNA-binding protein/quercetin dioxygenase-like cupin family protein